MGTGTNDDPKQTLVVRDRNTPLARRGSNAGDVLVVPVGHNVHQGGQVRAPKIGEIVGTYKLLEVLGEGAVGRVYLAEHTILGRRVALKMLHQEFNDDPSLIRRFFAEAKTVTQINHDNIVSITDFVVSDKHPSFYIMELLEGRTLAERISTGVPLQIEDVLEIARQLSSALAAAHDKGVVHRDLKPANVFLTERGGRLAVKLLDFGVAKLNQPNARGQTQAGAMVGTPEYMSPEATYGVQVDARADLYSLGVVLYEMLVMRPPFRADTVERVIEFHRKRQPVSPREVADSEVIPEMLDALVLRCLAKSAGDRPRSAQEVSEELDRLLEPEPLLPLPQNSRSSGLGFAMGGLLGVLLLGGLGYGAYRFAAPTDVTAPVVIEVAPKEARVKPSPKPVEVAGAIAPEKSEAPEKTEEIEEAEPATEVKPKAPRKRFRKKRKRRARRNVTVKDKPKITVEPRVVKQVEAKTTAPKKKEKEEIGRGDTLDPFRSN